MWEFIDFEYKYTKKSLVEFVVFSFKYWVEVIKSAGVKLVVFVYVYKKAASKLVHYINAQSGSSWRRICGGMWNGNGQNTKSRPWAPFLLYFYWLFSHQEVWMDNSETKWLIQLDKSIFESGLGRTFHSGLYLSYILVQADVTQSNLCQFCRTF